MLAALHDAIDRYNYSFKWECEISDKTKVISYYFDEIDVEKLKSVLTDDTVVSKEIVIKEDHCSDCGGRTNTTLEVVYNLSEDEKVSELGRCIAYRNAARGFINRCLVRKPDQLESFNKITATMENFKNF